MMLNFHEAFTHALFAAPVALFVGLALAAILDWITRREEDATVREMRHRCCEALLGGAIEGFVVTLIIAAIEVPK